MHLVTGSNDSSKVYFGYRSFIFKTSINWWISNMIHTIEGYVNFQSWQTCRWCQNTTMIQPCGTKKLGLLYLLVDFRPGFAITWLKIQTWLLAVSTDQQQVCKKNTCRQAKWITVKSSLCANASTINQVLNRISKTCSEQDILGPK